MVSQYLPRVYKKRSNSYYYFCSGGLFIVRLHFTEMESFSYLK